MTIGSGILNSRDAAAAAIAQHREAVERAARCCEGALTSDTRLVRRALRPARSATTIVVAMAAALLAVGRSTVLAGPPEPVRDLPAGDPERKMLLDLLRPVLELELRGPIEFHVGTARTLKGWGLVHVEPRRPGGGRIDLRETVFAEEPFMDGTTTDALFRRQGGRWHLITHVVGPTDAAASNWIFGAVPRRLFMPDVDDEEESR